MNYNVLVIAVCVFMVDSTLGLVAQNLVPNPSFEYYTQCPDNEFQVHLATPWQSFNNTSDYFNACNDGGLAGAPNSELYGFQYPFHGNGQMGFIAQGHNDLTGMNREVIGVELTEPLEPGVHYYVTFQMVRGFGGGAHPNCDCAVGNIGLKFTTRAYTFQDRIPLDNQADILYEPVYLDTLNWLQVWGYFAADSAYTHLCIGNFFQPQFNTVISLNGYEFINTYYFIDAVCVSRDPLDCLWAMAKDELEFNGHNWILYPNPAAEVLIIKSIEAIKWLRCTDTIGRDCPISIEQFEGDNLFVYRVNMHSLASGAYFLYAEFENGNVNSKSIIKF